MSRIDLTASRRDATFVALLEGRRIIASTLPAAIAHTACRYRTRGCAAIVAMAYGEHPEVAAPRMRRASSLVAAAYPAGCPGRSLRCGPGGSGGAGCAVPPTTTAAVPAAA